MTHLWVFSTIARDMGRILWFIGAISTLPLLVGIYYQEYGYLIAMATAPLIFGMLGFWLGRTPPTEREASLSVVIASVALIWLIASLVSALPFVLGIHLSFTDSVFEAMSGWTSTGLSLIPSVDNTPHILLFWRSLTQWMGGLGIVAFTVAMASRSSLTHFRLYRTEGRSEAFMPSVVATAVQMWRIYLILTGISIAIILISGISLWDAVNLAMTAISTGGFSVHSTGILYYQNPLLEYLLIPVMIAGAMPFELYFMIYYRRHFGFFGNRQAQLLLLFIAVVSLAVGLDLILYHVDNPLLAIRHSLFTVTSAITCTGFQNADVFSWTSVTVVLLSVFMLIGGSAGSTAGGIKLSRVVLWYETLQWWFRKTFNESSHAIIPLRHDGKPIQNIATGHEVSKNLLIAMLFVLTVIIGSLIVLHVGGAGRFDSFDVVFEIISAISNVGLSTGYVNPGMSVFAKWVFILVMWLGRLEILPVIVLTVGVARGFQSYLPKT
jgi:trk system potassium uptake protein TrkH